MILFIRGCEIVVMVGISLLCILVRNWECVFDSCGSIWW